MEIKEYGAGFLSLKQFVLSGWSDIEELFAFREAFLRENPGQQMLFILDNADQAGYTSGHAGDLHGLTPYGDVLDLTAEQMAVWEQDYVAPPEVFSRYVVNQILAKLDERLEIANPIHLESSDRDFFDCLKDENQIFASPIFAATVFADETSMGIAAHPNVYFSDDLSPMQNYLLAELLRVEFGLELFGLGSFLAGYLRSDPFTGDDAERLIARVRGLLYEMTDAAATKWVEATVGQRWFVLSYSGSS